ncbi:unnamed protein product, partial [Effrenium voratum]
SRTDGTRLSRQTRFFFRTREARVEAQRAFLRGMAGAEDSDLETRQLHLEANEVLIPKEDAREVEASRFKVTRRSLLLALCLGLVLLVPVRKNVQAVVSQLLQLDEEPPEDMPCFVQGVYYHHPAMMAGELETYQPSPEACQ